MKLIDYSILPNHQLLKSYTQTRQSHSPYSEQFDEQSVRVYF